MGIGYLYTKGDPDVWIRPAVKLDGTEYHRMLLCYIDNVLEISATKMKTIEGIKAVFKLKGDKAEVPDMHLGASIQKVETADGTECWMMSAEKYVKASVDNVELKLSKRNCRLPSRCDTLMATTYHPSEDGGRHIRHVGSDVQRDAGNRRCRRSQDQSRGG